MRDTDLRRNIITELESEPDVNAASIGVAVTNGIVTLTGHVPTLREKLAAERLVRRIKGVLGIAQEIEVRYWGTGRRDDDGIVRRVLQVLKWDSAVPDGAIKVTVDKGLVSLSGEVALATQRDSAERAVQRMNGVTGIVNQITIGLGARPLDVKNKDRGSAQTLF